MRIRFLLLLAVCVVCPAQDYLGRLSTGDAWRNHLLNDLLPWWTTKVAIGDPPGSFPTVRCDDGSLFDHAQPCAEVAANTWIDPAEQSIVGLSRQTYAYGVAFHMTGDTKYLDYMRQGVAFLRANYVDRVHGGFLKAGDPQQFGYGLLGLAFYYYLTRDPEVLPDILTLQGLVFEKYWNAQLSALAWQSGGEGSPDRRLVAQLDQMNTYHILLAPILPEPWQADWRLAIRNLSGILRSQFYSEPENLFFLSANSRADLDLAQTGTDFGHSAKALWMIRFGALIEGDREVAAWAERNGKRLLERAYLPDSGSWAQGVLKGGAVDPDKNWWIYAELDQLSATLALTDSAAGRYLPDTHNYWLRYFVDTRYGEVWNGVKASDNSPIRSLPKQWAWKNGYHSLEHALVSYIAGEQLHGRPVTLYYAFGDQLPGAVSPYYFRGTVTKSENSAGVWKMEFANVQ